MSGKVLAYFLVEMVTSMCPHIEERINGKKKKMTFALSSHREQQDPILTH